MNDSEIIKALECCNHNHVWQKECFDCEYATFEANCGRELVKDALDLIKRQQAEIDRLNIDLKAMRGAANSYKAHYEDLKSENLETIKILKTAKSEAVREFAEKLKPMLSFGRYTSYEQIDNLVKEMGCNNG